MDLRVRGYRRSSGLLNLSPSLGGALALFFTKVSMRFFCTRLAVPPNCRGYVYKRNSFLKELHPGIEYFLDPLRYLSLYLVPTQELVISAENQEVLTKDLIAFRFSYSVSFSITEPQKLMSIADLSSLSASGVSNLSYQAITKVHLESQVILRERIAQIDSQEINARRSELFDGCIEQLTLALKEYGITPTRVWLRDITFPKRILELFAQELESQIRARADLENARTRVAAARALKNAGEILKGDPTVNYMQYLETITKIASAGKHTFVIGEQPPLTSR